MLQANMIVTVPCFFSFLLNLFMPNYLVQYFPGTISSFHGKEYWQLQCILPSCFWACCHAKRNRKYTFTWQFKKSVKTDNITRKHRCATLNIHPLLHASYLYILVDSRRQKCTSPHLTVRTPMDA